MRSEHRVPNRVHVDVWRRFRVQIDDSEDREVALRGNEVVHAVRVGVGICDVPFGSEKGVVDVIEVIGA